MLYNPILNKLYIIISICDIQNFFKTFFMLLNWPYLTLKKKKKILRTSTILLSRICEEYIFDLSFF